MANSKLAKAGAPAKQSRQNAKRESFRAMWTKSNRLGLDEHKVTETALVRRRCVSFW